MGSELQELKAVVAHLQKEVTRLSGMVTLLSHQSYFNTLR
jgi:hypothetical protein